MHRLLVAVLALSTLAFAGENLKLNDHLDFDSDSQDGRLITGDHMDDGIVGGKPNYVLIIGEG